MARVQSVPKFFHRISKTSASCALTSPLGVHSMPALFFLLFVAFLLGILIGWLMRRRPSGDGRDISVFSPGPDQQPRADTLPGPEAAPHKHALSIPSPLPRPFPGPIPSPIPSPFPIPFSSPVALPILLLFPTRRSS